MNAVRQATVTVKVIQGADVLLTFTTFRQLPVTLSDALSIVDWKATGIVAVEKLLLEVEVRRVI